MEWDDDDEVLEMDVEDEPVELGPCCACGVTGPTVRNFMMLSKHAPVAGTGWGCVVCGLPSDGAIAVVCDACVDASVEITEVCDGWVQDGGRCSVDGLADDVFDHNLEMHRNEQAVMPRLGGPIYWQHDDGELVGAVWAYVRHMSEREVYAPPTEVQLGIVIQYCQRWIQDDCWVEIDGQLAELRQESLALVTLDDVAKWLLGCLSIGIDPL